MSETKVGTIIDSKFELLEEVGAGGMGLVYRAKQQGLERIVALKILEPTLVSDNESLARFEREARSISLLHHVHIASFFSYGIHEGTAPYIAMEFLEGKNLKAVIQETENGMEWQRALKIGLEICDAMDYAHAQGVVHRDLKPNNIILLESPKPDWVKVVDFGLAKLSELTDSGKQRLTKTGELLGSVDYLSPEQCLGRQTDQRSDIYSLACILFEMLTGRTPFQSDNPIGQIHKHANEESPFITTVSQKLFPPGLELLVKKSLSKDPAERYQQMSDLGADLKLILDGKGGELINSLAQYGQRTAKKAGVNKTVVASIVMVALLSATAGGAGWFFLTDAGLLYQARSELAGTPKLGQQLAWLMRADKLEADGKPQPAHMIRAEVMHPLEAKNENEFGIPKMYLSLASEYQKKGNASLAAKAGWQALQEVFKTQTPPVSLGGKSSTRSRLYLETIEKASAVALQYPNKYTKTEAGMLQKLARPMMNVPGPFTLNLVDLLERVVDDARMPANAETVECYRLRAGYLASTSKDLARIQKAIVKASREALRVEGPKAASPSEAWSDAARTFAARGYKEQALVYAKKAEPYFETCEPKVDNQTLYGSMTLLVKAYLDLGMPSDASRVARKLKEYACMETAECAFCAEAHNTLASALSKSSPAESARAWMRSSQLYRGLDYTDNPDAMKTYRGNVYQMERWKEKNQLSSELKKQIELELQNSNAFLNKHVPD